MKRKWMALVLVVCMLAVSTPAAIADEWADAWAYTADTPLIGSAVNKLTNLELAVAALDGTVVFYGDTFSFNEVIGPRTFELGYRSARNGRGAKVIGGGVSQLASTLYLAARDCDYLSFEEFGTYGEDFADWYVENGEDAIITDYERERDFAFTSWYDGYVYISAWMDEENLYCSVELLDDLPGDYENLVATASTPIFGSDNKRHNIQLTSEAIDGFQMEFGDIFSFNEIVGPRSQEAGFYNAENGRGVRVRGGGVAQVASTIYLALKELDCVSVDPVRTYGDRFTDGYVENAEDAVVTDYNAGHDLSFIYWGDGTLTVSVYEEGNILICDIFEE